MFYWCWCFCWCDVCCLWGCWLRGWGVKRNVCGWWVGFFGMSMEDWMSFVELVALVWLRCGFGGWGHFFVFGLMSMFVSLL